MITEEQKNIKAEVLAKALGSFELNRFTGTGAFDPATIPPYYSSNGVYIILCKVDERIYVGSTTMLLRRRLGRHFAYLRAGKHLTVKLQQAFNLYGINNFICYFLEECANKKTCIKREQFYMDLLQPFDDNGFNHNRKARSSAGMPRSENTCLKISQRWHGRPQAWKDAKWKITSAAWKKARSNPETLKRIRDSVIKPFALKKDGKIFKGRNIRAFAREHGLLYGAVLSVNSGRLQHFKGWTRPESRLKFHTTPDGRVFADKHQSAETK